MLLATPAPAPVVASHSWYVGDLDPSHLRAVAAADELEARGGGLKQAVVVLDYGDPAVVAGSTNLPDHRGVAPAAGIAASASAYALGWTRQPAAPQLVLVVATSNYGAHVDAAHGAAWGRVADAVQAAAPQVDVRGGFDDEMDYGGPEATLAWLQGYQGGTLRPFVDLGDCACTAGQALPGSWTLDERIQLATAGSVLPQQYRTSGIDAQRWAHLDASAGKKLRFLGVLTETRACAGPPPRDCAFIDQTPAAAYASLTRAIKRPAGLSTDIGYLAPLPKRPAKRHVVADALAGVVLFALLALSVVLLRRRRRRVR